MRRLIESISGASQIAVQILLYPLLRGWRRRWGSRQEERALELPGDGFVPEPQWTYNHAVSIDAPRSVVWRWVVQLGQGRGGFHTYEGLENLVGCQIHNVVEIHPQLQQLRVGDTIVTHGRSGFGPPVTRIEPERALVLGGAAEREGLTVNVDVPLARGPGQDHSAARAWSRRRQQRYAREAGVRPLPGRTDRLRDEQEDAPDDQEARRGQRPLTGTSAPGAAGRLGRTGTLVPRAAKATRVGAISAR
jgi:hypothetical protein